MICDRLLDEMMTAVHITSIDLWSSVGWDNDCISHYQQWSVIVCWMRWWLQSSLPSLICDRLFDEMMTAVHITSIDLWSSDDDCSPHYQHWSVIVCLMAWWLQSSLPALICDRQFDEMMTAVLITSIDLWSSVWWDDDQFSLPAMICDRLFDEMITAVLITSIDLWSSVWWDDDQSSLPSMICNRLIDEMMTSPHYHQWSVIV